MIFSIAWSAAMTSHSHDLEQELQKNLELRRELGAEVVKATGSSASRRVRRSFVSMGVLIVVILALAIAARLVGEGTSMLPWHW
jgi:ferric-dicitrate binding protein FerR (iron transport regulator)